MNAEFDKVTINGEVEAISSKSFAHRMLICSALADVPSHLQCNVLSQDMIATMQCLNALGADIRYNDGCFNVTPLIQKRLNVDKSVVLDCKECGSILRFLLPIAAALGVNAEFNGEGRLPERPIGEILELLAENGIEVNGKKLPVRIKGKLNNGVFRIAGTVSSQYITGLLIALPLLRGDSTLIIDGEQLSKPYIDITTDVLKRYGITIIDNGGSYFISGNQKYNAIPLASVEGDWSNAAFWVALGACGNSITIKEINCDSLQGDKSIINVAEAMGANISFCDNGTIVKVNGGELHGIEFDARNVPDIVPVIAMMCHYANGESRIRNVDRLREKESDRLGGIIDTILRLGGSAHSDGNDLYINGRGAGYRVGFNTIDKSIHERIILNGFKDHRMVMMGILAGIIYGNIVVTDTEALDKSYPNLFEHLQSLGATFSVIDD